MKFYSLYDKVWRMDVHKEAIVIAVRNTRGHVVMESIVETKANSILQFIHGLQGEPPRDLRRFPAGYFSRKSRSRPSSAQLASTGEIIPPWGVPSVVS